jgi:undecaprenyl-diphosphatase
MNSFDLTVYHMLNHLATPSHPILNTVMKFFAQDALEIYAILFVIAWFTLPKQDTKSRHALVVSGCAGILALLINVIIGHIWYRPRPFVALPKGTFNQIIPHSVDASFPSDHTSGSFGFASASWGKNVAWVRYSFTIIAILTMISRVYCGVHYPTDVIGGLVVGVFAGRVMWRFSGLLQPVTDFGLRLFKFGTFSKPTHTKTEAN